LSDIFKVELVETAENLTTCLRRPAKPLIFNKFSMRFKFISLLILALMTTILSGCQNSKKQEEIMSLEASTQKNAVIVIAFQGFQDFEYSKTRQVLEDAGIKIIVASSLKGEAHGKLGQKVTVDIIVDEIIIEEFDALVFIGGPGALEYVDSLSVHQLVQRAVSQDKVLAAICIAPEILAKAGVLKSKKATIWSSLIDQSPIGFLENEGAKYIEESVVVDGKIITANGPEAANEFGQKIIEALK